MKTRATEENILKYLQVLKNLKLILDNTSNLSMLNFSKQNKVTKNLSTVLQKGKIIKLIKKGRYSEWKWISIAPNKQMAIKTLQELSKLNPPRKKKPAKVIGNANKNNSIKVNDIKPSLTKEKIIDHYELKLLFGLISFKIKPHFK